MITITEYPFTFKLAGESWELQEHMVIRTRTDGRENKLALTGSVKAAAFDEKVDEFAVGVYYPNQDHYLFMSKQYGWLGPFKTLKDILFENGVAVVVSEDGKHPLKV